MATVLSTKVTRPLPALSRTVAIWAQLMPGGSVIAVTKPVSLAALSVQVRFTTGPAAALANRLVGAGGTGVIPVWMGTVLETVLADMVSKPAVCVSPTVGPMAQTLYQYDPFLATVVSVNVTWLG